MRPVALALVLALGLTASPLAAYAQPAPRAHRIGYLSLQRPEGDRSWVAAFRQGLRELGYVEGENVIIQQRHAAGRAERLPALASELVGLQVDVLVVYGVWALIGAGWKPPATLPIVFTVDAFGNHEFRGKVESFSPGTGAQFALLPPENATGNFTKIIQRVPVRVAVSPDVAEQGLLRPGLSVVVSVDKRDRPEPARAAESSRAARENGL